MKLNPFAPTFRPQQRPKPYSFSRPKTLVTMNSSQPFDSLATDAKASAAEPPSPQIEEQIRLLSVQLNQLQTYSESSIQQTTPLLQKFRKTRTPNPPAISLPTPERKTICKKNLRIKIEKSHF